MELTLRIIAHELEDRFGTACYDGVEEKRQVSDVRLACVASDDPKCLYVLDAGHADEAKVPAGATVLEVGPSAEAAGCMALCCDADAAEVFTCIQEVFLRYRNWLHSLDESIIEDKGIQDLFDLSEAFLVNNVIVVDPALKLLAYTKGIACDDEVTVELIKHGYHTEKNIRKFRIDKRFDVWATQNGFIINDSNRICKYTTAVYTFKTLESFSLIFVMMCNNVDPQPWLFDTFIMFLIRAAFYSKRDYGTDSPSGSSVKSFMRDLLDGKLRNAVEVEERRKHLGIPVAGNFCLFSIDIGDQQHMIARIISDISRRIAPAKAVVYGDSIVILCFNCQDEGCAFACEAGACPLHRSTMTTRLNKALQSYGLQAGRSAGFAKLEDVPTAFRQAQAALNARNLALTRGSSSVRGHKSLNIANFDDWYFDCMVESCLSEDRALLSTLKQCRKIMCMREYDSMHNTDNCKFLLHYLRFERRTTTVAEHLHMHRNNVKYRIGRIEEQFNIDTDNPDDRLELVIAFRILLSLGYDVPSPVCPDLGEGSVSGCVKAQTRTQLE